MSDFDFTTKGKDFCWSNTPYTTTALNEMPFIEMIGYAQTWSSAIESINYWMSRDRIGISVANPYSGLYLGERKSYYKLPYFNEYHHEISQSWAANQGAIDSTINQVLKLGEDIGRAFLPAAGILSPKSYEGSGPGTYAFVLNLINTNGGSNPKTDLATNITNNKKLLESLIKDSLHDQNNSLSVAPPLIYSVYIPGVRWAPVAVVTGLSVKNKGSLNTNRGGILGSLPQNYIYPDAWEVTISITELIDESRKIFNDAIKDSPTGDGTMTTRVFP